MFYEKSVNSFSRLAQEIGLLDLDSGIRTYVNHEGKKKFAFLTRSPRGYTVMVYSRRLQRKKFVPHERLLVKEFGDRKGLEEFLRRFIARPIRAFVY